MTEPAWWPPLRDAPGWATLYAQLQAGTAVLDPAARVQVIQRPHRLHLRVIEANPAVQQSVRDICFDAEAASIRTCQTCGEPGEVRLAETESRWRVRCDAHADDPFDEPEWITISALRMIDLRPQMVQLLDDGWHMTRLEKPVMEGHRGELTVARFERP